MPELDSIDELRTLRGTPSERALGKVLPALDRHCMRFVELSPFCVVGSIDERGRPDVSPRGGPPGFVKTPDAHTLLMPDRPGNNRLDTLSNVIGNSSVALLFLVPGIDETLRVYGSAEVVAESPDLAPEPRAKAELVLRTTVRHAYFQCAKSLMRARLWSAESNIDRGSFPPLGEILKEQMKSDAPAESQDAMVQRYLPDL